MSAAIASFVSHDTAFEDLFEDYVQSRTEDRDQDGRLHPSALYFCDRKLVYDLRLTPREPTSGSKRPLLVGKVLHSELQAALEYAVGKTIRDLYIEGRVDDPDTGIFGNFDALVEWIDGTWELIEIKSANAYSYKLVSKSGEAKPGHVNQALTYVDVIRRVGFTTEHDATNFRGDPYTYTKHHDPIPDLDRARVIYLDKDRHGLTEKVYRWTPKWKADLDRHIARIERYRSDGEALPPRLPTGSWQCAAEDGAGRWCPFWNRCQKVDKEGSELDG